METYRKQRQRSTFRIALVGSLSAISLALLYLSALLPSGRMGVVAAAGLIPAGAVVSAGLAAGFFCYGVTGLLGLILLPMKENVLLYLLFFGIYPMIKSLIERLRRPALELLLKLLFLNGMLTLLYFGLSALFLPFLPSAVHQTWILYLIGNLGFLIYDIGFSKLITFYCTRIDRVLRKRV